MVNPPKGSRNASNITRNLKSAGGNIWNQSWLGETIITIKILVGKED